MFKNNKNIFITFTKTFKNIEKDLLQYVKYKNNKKRPGDEIKEESKERKKRKEESKGEDRGIKESFSILNLNIIINFFPN